MLKTIHSHHLGWNSTQAPQIEIAPGDSLELKLQDASGNRVDKDADAGIIASLKPENANPLTGPVWIDGAEPGDTLVVDILDFAHSDFGWTALIPGFGLLAKQFVRPFLHISEYDAGHIRFTPDIILPTRPFAGTIGVCPSGQETLGAIPPHQCGGNMDFKSLTAGSRLYFPVQVPGALFSAGDGHAAQGDGEVCGTAVETQLSMGVTFSLLKNMSLPAPKAEIQVSRYADDHLVTTGIAPDLMQASQEAVSYMIDELVRRYGLSAELAYCLCSCAADLRIAELVNAPNWTVACCLPLSIFR
ncbi:MAG: acetamidase/formamidase family protein [Pseudohongiellaceae bacterium]